MTIEERIKDNKDYNTLMAEHQVTYDLCGPAMSHVANTLQGMAKTMNDKLPLVKNEEQKCKGQIMVDNLMHASEYIRLSSQEALNLDVKYKEEGTGVLVLMKQKEALRKHRDALLIENKTLKDGIGEISEDGF